METFSSEFSSGSIFCGISEISFNYSRLHLTPITPTAKTVDALRGLFCRTSKFIFAIKDTPHGEKAVKLTRCNAGKIPMKSKHRSFFDCVSKQQKAISDAQPIISQIPEPEKIKHTLIGSRKAVMETISILQEFGYADALDWSPLLPTSNPGEFISILIRQITVQ